ncbi:zinc-binding protein A33 isoform X2 [Scleropages formosus]|uniref:zinc-binding protein A33 isoform X2 n=1 Tax=Scleropages formosus TaxID=113540 RepID=UPI0008790837|nr:zinc-binding protein A33-like isoform X2 [Scleropages formosus]
MAWSQSFLSTEQFLCSICLDIFINPISIPCGHSFCMACISRYWDECKTCQCPMCKETFRMRPDLHINRTLREITEQFKGMAGIGIRNCRRTSNESLPGRDELPGEIFANMTSLKIPSRIQDRSRHPTAAPQPKVTAQTSTSTPASSSKLMLRRFTLGGQVENLPLCQKQQWSQEFFCKTDQVCTSDKCGDKDHPEHDVVLADRKQLVDSSLLGTAEKEIQEMIQERVKKVEELRTSLVEIQISAESEVRGSVGVFTALVSSIERRQAELLEIIETNRQAAERQAVKLIQELEEEIEELRQRSSSLTHLLQSEDKDFLHKMKDWSSISVNPDLCIGRIHNTVSQLVMQFEEELKRVPERSIRTSEDFTPLRSQPRVKKIHEYAEVTLDSNTAHPRLILSTDRKQVKCGDKHQAVPDNPKRFDRVFCVLGQEGFTSGRHYWEVEVKGKTEWDLGVARHSAKRKGKITVNPSRGYWFLSLRDKSNFSCQDETSLSCNEKPQKIGVFLDYDKGQVSFFNVDAKLHIYTFHDTFTESIYPFFCPCSNKSGRNDSPLIITPVIIPK